MRTMYDSISPDLIPATAQAVAGYVSGRYAWSPADWARFPHAVRIRIDVDGSQPYLSDVIDCERYDVTPQGAASWCRLRQQRHGWWSAVYCDRSSWPSVQAACRAVGADRVSWWVADWTGEPHLLPGSVATQYASSPGYDLSMIADHWFTHPAPGWKVP